jgi:cation transport ATPase
MRHEVQRIKGGDVQRARSVLELAAFGLLNPVVAGAAMAMSSVSVVSNSLLLKRWHPAKE